MEPEIGDLWREYPDKGLAGPEHSIYEIKNITTHYLLVLWAGPGPVMRQVTKRRLLEGFIRWRAARYAVLSGTATPYVAEEGSSSSGTAASS